MEKEKKLIGLCLSKLIGQVQVEIIKHITERASREGYKVLVFATFTELYYHDRAEAGESMVFELIDYDMFDGIILMAETIKEDSVIEKIVHNCKEHHVPLVAIDKEISDAYSILYDYTDAFEEIVRHVIEVHGCRRINLISGIKGNSFSEEREAVYKRVLEENGIEVEPERIGYGDFWEAPTIEVVKKFLNSSLEFPEAIICCNDTMAMTACGVLEEYGYSVPKDVIVTGFDGCEEEQYHVPRLTTAHMDIKKAAYQAVDSIIRINKKIHVKRVQMIPFDVTASQSCGCISMQAKGQAKNVRDIYNMMSYRNDFDEFVSRVAARITNSESLSKAKKVIQNYAFMSSVLCLRDNFLEINVAEKENEDKFTGKMHVFAYKFEDGQERTFEDFPAKQILPNLWEMFEKEDMLVVTILHFLDKIIGYYVLPIQGEQLQFTYVQRFVRELGQSIYITRNAERMRFLLTKDQLTKIYNRRGFYQHIKKLLEDNLEDGEYYIIIHSVDLDGLKYINDTFGHKSGDNAIMVAAHKLEEASGHNEICARFGGDEYVVFGIAGKDEAEDIAKAFVARFKELLTEYNESSGLPYQVKASCGSSIVPVNPDLQLDQIISMADQLMYDEKAKHKRGQVR